MGHISYEERISTTRTAQECLESVKSALTVLGGQICASDSHEVTGKLGSRSKTVVLGRWCFSADALPVVVRAKVNDNGEARELELIVEEDFGVLPLGRLEGRYPAWCREVAGQLAANCREPDSAMLLSFK